MDWISVNDRMPKKASVVIIWTTISLEPTLGFYADDWLYLCPNGNFWIKDEPHIQVLYWMELPKRPNNNNDLFNLIDWIVSEMKNLDIKVGYSDTVHLMNLLNVAKERYKNELNYCWETAHQAGRFEGKGIAEKNWQTFDDFYEDMNSSSIE